MANKETKKKTTRVDVCKHFFADVCGAIIAEGNHNSPVFQLVSLVFRVLFCGVRRCGNNFFIESSVGSAI